MEHGVPSAFAGLSQPDCGLHVPATWHSSIAAHVTADPAQTPAMHLSLLVHALPSLQARPSGLTGFEHCPVLESQVPGSWHVSIAVHVTGGPATQVPLEQVSFCVQPLPSLHGEPLAFVGLVQVPVTGLHWPTSKHCPSAVQTTGCVPVHTPPMHTSTLVQALPSVHGVPSALVGVEQVPFAGLQVPAVWH
jgi:hypothetical protein